MHNHPSLLFEPLLVEPLHRQHSQINMDCSHFKIRVDVSTDLVEIDTRLHDHVSINMATM